MRHSQNIPLIRTVREHCRVCYTCVRECPAKAIRIADGQAEVVPERCIGCGNCVRICSQNAKQVLDSKPQVREMLASDEPVAAILAPSFPAEFTEIPWQRFVGRLRQMGFDRVHEVAFGADLVARRYKQLLDASGPQCRYIATSCPGVVGFVERYHPDLIGHLAPIVSPMVAEARVLRRICEGPLKIVFIGPCIAKKGEATSENLPDEIDAALTFAELREMFEELPAGPPAEESDFDPPHAGTGGLFSVSRGLLQAAGIEEDLIAGEVVATDGRTSFVEAIREFASGDMDVRLLEVLCCNGCIMGAGMSSSAPLFSRRRKVSRYVRERLELNAARDGDETEPDFEDLDLLRVYSASDQRLAVPFEEEIEQIMARMGKFTPEDELNCGACGYDSCRDHAIAIFKGLAESEMCLPHTIEQLRQTVGKLADSNQQLHDAQEQLMQSEKLASMGQLAAGIAHEVNNPLGVVLMYAHLLLEEYGSDENMREDVGMIVEQADRCKKIVAGLLHFARQNKVALQSCSVRELLDRCRRAITIPEPVTLEVVDELEQAEAELDPDQIIQVLTNLCTNAVGAMEHGGTLRLEMRNVGENVQIRIADTGVGIPEENLSRIFDPFFTTKQIGVGTGLGLAVTYGIVKMHRGNIQVESNADPQAGPTGTAFTITLPRREPPELNPATTL